MDSPRCLSNTEALCRRSLRFCARRALWYEHPHRLIYHKGVLEGNHSGNSPLRRIRIHRVSGFQECPPHRPRPLAVHPRSNCSRSGHRPDLPPRHHSHPRGPPSPTHLHRRYHFRHLLPGRRLAGILPRHRLCLGPSRPADGRCLWRACRAAWEAGRLLGGRAQRNCRQDGGDAAGRRQEEVPGALEQQAGCVRSVQLGVPASDKPQEACARARGNCQERRHPGTVCRVDHGCRQGRSGYSHHLCRLRLVRRCDGC